MDPALQQLLEGEADDPIEAIIRLRDPSRAPFGFKIVSQFGAVATGRLARRDIRRVWSDPAVRSLKASRLLQIEEERIPESRSVEPSETRRPDGVRETGAGCVVGVIDWGIDHDCASFKTRDGASRIRALWDQRGWNASGAVFPYGYGRVFENADINRALRSRRPYETLNYHPGDSAPNGASHGTHVTDIAAGNGLHGGPSGMAPDAEIVFVHLSAGALGGLANLGDSVRILEAIDFIDKAAGARPCAINMSVGRHAGPHTGRTLLEQGIDAFLALKPNRAVIMSSGNYHLAGVHASGQIAPGRAHLLTWRTAAGDPTTNELEVWYSNKDKFVATLTPPDSLTSFVVQLGDNKSIKIGDTEVGRLYHRANDPNTPDHHIDIFLYPNAAPGSWRVTLTAEKVVDGRFHAWIERDSARRGEQSRFAERDVDATHTLGSICNGFHSISCGAANLRGESIEIASFSSEGPTRDGRQKPDIVAPGVSILAASSAPIGESRATGAFARKSGASQAAPHVAGTAALVFEAAARPLSVHDVRRAIIGAAQSDVFPREEENRFGAGLLNVEGAIRAVKAAPERRLQFIGRRFNHATNGEAAMPHGGLEDSRAQEAGRIAGAEEADGETLINAALGEAAMRMSRAGSGSVAADIFDRFAYGAEGANAYADYFDIVALPNEQLPDEVFPDDIIVQRGLASGARADMRRAYGHPPSPGRAGIQALKPGARVPRNILVLRQRPGGGAPRYQETVLHSCRPGEGPPAALPDPEGRGLHPLVYGGTTRRRSRNPTVGDAQILLNNFLRSLDPSFSSCTFASSGGAQRARQYLAALASAGQNPLVVDCRFGSNTDRATRVFQLCKGITEDGKIGPQTWPLLEAYRAPPPVTPPITPPVVPAAVINPPRWDPILRRAFRGGAALRAGNAVKFLIDGRDTYASMVDALRTARGQNSFILLLGWVLKDQFNMKPGVSGTKMRELLTDAARHNAKIRLMLWEQFPLPPANLRSNRNAVNHVNSLPGDTMAILDNETLQTAVVRCGPFSRRVKTGAHHQKVLVVKGEESLVGFCGGLDVNEDRIRAGGGSGGSNPISGVSGSGSSGAGNPQHDVHCRIEGPSALDLFETVRRRWVHHPDPRPFGIPAPAAAAVGRLTSANTSVARTCSVAIARTFLPANSRAPRECDIRALLIAAIRNANRFIYIEDQYLISLELARLLQAAAPRLRHITLLTSSNETSDELQCPISLRRRFITEARRGLSPADRRKIRVFNRIDASGDPAGPHTKIHAKTWVIDDELAVIGSANCNRRGWESDSEANAFVFDDAAAIDRNPITPAHPSFAQAMRMRLWSEHLGLPSSALVDGVAGVAHWARLPPTARVRPLSTVGTDSPVCGCQTPIVDPHAPCP